MKAAITQHANSTRAHAGSAIRQQPPTRCRRGASTSADAVASPTPAATHTLSAQRARASDHRRETAIGNQIATLPEAEFKKLAAAVGRRLEKETNMSGQAIAAEADLNHDGVVTEAELSAWWRRRAPTLLAVSASRATEPPTRSQLMKLGLVAAVPCFTFGFLDNAIMLVAGEQIEAHLGMSWRLSAMACAAMGNIVATRRARSPAARSSGY